MATLQVSVKGEMGLLSATSFIVILQRSLQILQDLDRRMSEEWRGTVDWVINHVREGSIDVELASRPRRGVQEDYGLRAVEGFTRGLRTIHTIGETPAYFSQDNLVAVLDMVRQFGRDGVSGVAYIPGDDLLVELTREAEPELQKLVGIRYRALGAIEGRIELISVRRGSRRFNLTHARTLRTIRCNLPDSIEESAIEAMRDRRRVVASGVVGYNGKDEAIRLDVRQPLRFLGRAEELPKGRDLAGSDPDITGSMSTEDFVRSIRDG